VSVFDDYFGGCFGLMVVVRLFGGCLVFVCVVRVKGW